MNRRIFRSLCLGVMGRALLCAAMAQTPPLPEESTASFEAQIEVLLEQLTLEEKVSLMSGESTFRTEGIERLGIRPLEFRDGPSGVRSTNSDPTFAYPVGVALASSWNPVLVERVGAAIGRDARDLGVDVVLAPSVNIQRLPQAGRNFEQYSEDPLLTARLAIAYIRGVQGEGIGACLKHYVGNEQEFERRRIDSRIDPRTLREIYLRPFETVVRGAYPWSVMAAYNRVNGFYMTEQAELLTEVLKEEWQYDGVVMSDWGAVHSTTASAQAGLDLEMPGPPKFYGDRLIEAVNNWKVDETRVDDAARRMLRLILRCGGLEDAGKGPREKTEVGDEAVAVQAAEEGIVLLRNDSHLLPLNPSEIASIAIIGPNADRAIAGGGGSSRVIPSRLDTPLEAIREMLPEGIVLSYVKGVDNDVAVPPADAHFFSPTIERKTFGLQASYFGNEDLSGEPEFVELDRWFRKKGFGEAIRAKTPTPAMSVRWEGYFWPPVDGKYELEIWGYGRGRLELDGEFLLGGNPDANEGWIGIGEAQRCTVELQTGRPVPIRIEHLKLPDEWPYFSFRLRAPSGSIEEAVAAARVSDVAIVFVGSSLTSEAEGSDRERLGLWGDQDELVRAVCAVNPRTIVVLQSGGPVTLPWQETVPALMQAWFPGEMGSEAIARVIFGKTNPSGKLPVSFPRREQDYPAFLHYGGEHEAIYGEGVFVGYRYYDTKGIEPLFPFGFGLSYTQFRLSDLSVPEIVTTKDSVRISVIVENVGEVVGSEVVQLYVGDEEARRVPRPIRELRAFAKILLEPGEAERVSFELNSRDFSYYDAKSKTWKAEEGRYRVWIGSSSRDLPLSSVLELRPCESEEDCNSAEEAKASRVL